MCGRTACTLAPNDLVQSCTYINKKGKETKPTWREATNGRTYYPSYNVCPGAMTPILFSSKHLDKFKLKDSVDHVTDWSLMPMQWGLVPSWHTGDPKSVSYKMTNARSDGILDKKSFKTPLQKGRRCVVIADGYYEWHTSKDGGKQPYFIYPPSDDVAKPNDVTKVWDDTKVDDVTKVKGESHEDCSASISDESAKNGRRLMMMAGLFDIWTSETGDVLFTYSIITVDAHKHVAWIHHRMPAILNGEEEVRQWLDFDDVDLTTAVTSLIRPRDCLRQHPVSRAVVGNVHNKTEDCVKPFDIEKENQKKKAKSNFMQNWLQKSSPAKKENGKRTIKTEPTEAEYTKSLKLEVKIENNLKIKQENSG